MFTPPPSPRPLVNDKDPLSTLDVNADMDSIESSLHGGPISASMSPSDVKRRIGRRTKLTVIFVPLALVLITASTRYLTHPIALDIFSDAPHLQWDWHKWSSQATDWKLHKRHPADDSSTNDSPSSAAFPSVSPSASPSASSSASSVSSAATTTITAQPIPTIPSTPPPLPTPFPQPFDSDITQNFSSTSCYNFFQNMTNLIEFRSCRPFSFLLQTSDVFIQAQDNLTELNTIIWGTCNTNTTADQCGMTMGGFASQLQTECSQDLTDNNANAHNALVALEAYSIMRQAACAPDQPTNTYCYLKAVQNPNPSDLYFYNLPLGISLPNSSTPTCSGCTKTLMADYSQALTARAALDGLQETYDSAAAVAVRECGTGYAAIGAAVNGAGQLIVDRRWTLLMGVALWLVLGLLL